MGQKNTSALQAMLKAYNSILASVRGKASFNRGLLHQSQLKGPTEFHLFADLPPELRRLIWTSALPSRIIEASLKYAETSWRCHISGSRLDSLDSRQIYTLFSVNSESRAVCLESYISFCGVYVHRRLDVLYLSWQQSQPGATIQHRSSSLPIEASTMTIDLELWLIACELLGHPDSFCCVSSAPIFPIYFQTSPGSLFQVGRTLSSWTGQTKSRNTWE